MYHRINRTIDDVIEPTATTLDSHGRFGRENIETLGATGMLGLTVRQEHGGAGEGLATAATIVERVAASCASTATVLQAHYAAVPVLEEYAPDAVLREIATGNHLTTLALGESDASDNVIGPEATPPYVHGNVVDLYGRKAPVAAASEADSYVWSSATAGDSSPSLWLVPANAPGIHVPVGCGPTGLRGAGLAPITAEPVQVPDDMLLGLPGQGRSVIGALVLPWFIVLGAAVNLGIVEGTIGTLAATGDRDGDGYIPPADLGWMRACADAVREARDDVLATAERSRELTPEALLLLRSRAEEAALDVTDLAASHCEKAGAEVRAAIDRRRRDARTTYGIGPDPVGIIDREADVTHPAREGTPQRAALSA